MCYLRSKRLDVVARSTGDLEGDNAELNEDVFAELALVVDEQSLSIIIGQADNDGREALKVLREHHCGSGKPKILSLYCTLTSLEMQDSETVTEYMLRAERAWTPLKEAGESLSDGLIVAMLLKGLPESFKPLEVFITQSEKEYSISDFRKAVKEFEGHQKPKDAVMNVSYRKRQRTEITCYDCKKIGHKRMDCPNKREQKWCDFCRVRTHSYEDCRSKPTTRDTSRDTAASAQNFMFYVEDYVNQVEVCETDHVKTLVDCGATAHVVRDRSRFVSWDSSFDTASHAIELADGSRSTGIVQGRGRAEITTTDANGQSCTITLDNALYIPSYTKDIFSVHAATMKGASFSFSKDSAQLTAGDGTVFPIEKKGRLYYLLDNVKENVRKVRWCGYCKTRTHDTDCCRSKPEDTTASTEIFKF